MPNKSYKYSNGFEQERVLNVLQDRVRWKSAGSSKSGRFFDDGSFHGFVTEAAWKDSLSDGELTDAALSKQKADFCKAAVLRALSLVFPGPSLIDEPTMLMGITVRKGETQLPAGELHGLALCITDSFDFVVQIKSVVLQMSAAGDVSLYLFRRGDNTPVWTGSAKAEAGRPTIVDLADCYIAYRDQRATEFFFGYKPSELPGGMLPLKEYRQSPNCMSLLYGRPVQVNVLPGYDGDFVYPSYLMGLNVEALSLWDYTDKITRGASSFDELIGLCGAQIVLEQALFTSRMNGSERAIKENADRFALQMDLTGTVPVSDAPRTTGLRSRIASQVKAVQSSFTSRKGGVV